MKFKSITMKLLLKARPENVYNALTNPLEHSRFTGAKATGGDIVGGKFTAWDGYIHGRVIELVKNERIVLEWLTTEWPKDYPPSIVKFTLERKGEFTELVLVHSKVPASQASSYRQGWLDYYWTPLKNYFHMKK